MFKMFSKQARLLLWCILILWSIQSVSSKNRQQLRRVCYFTNWSCDLLVKEAYFCLHDLDVALCSHIIYAFAGINVTSLSLASTRVDDENIGTVKGRYIQFNELKMNNPDLKTLLSAGGSYQSEKFKNVTSTPASRLQFAYNTARYVRRWGFDGLDLDWEYPGELEKETLTLLVQDLRSAFRDEAMESGQPELLLSLAAPVGEERVRLGYQVDLLSKAVDMINLMAYDFYYGAWDITAFNSPLYSRQHRSFSNKHSVEYIIKLWISLGAPSHKINLGIAGYGQSFTLQLDQQKSLPPKIWRHGNSSHSGSVQVSSKSTNVSTPSTGINNIIHAVNKENSTSEHRYKSLLPFYQSENESVKRCDTSSNDCKARLSQNVSRSNRNSSMFDKLFDTHTFTETDLIKHDNMNTSIYGIDNVNNTIYGISNNETSIYGHANKSHHATRLAGDTAIFGIHRNKEDYIDTVLEKGESSNKLGSTSNTIYGVGSKATGPGRPGRLRHLKGQLSYPEICEMMQAGAVAYWDQEQRAPYITLGDQWAGFEDVRSVTEKVKWANEQHLGGVMFWSLDLDDFKGDYCGEGRYPLLSAMSDTVISLSKLENGNTPKHATHFTNGTHQFQDAYVTGMSTQDSSVSRDDTENNLSRPRTKSVYKSTTMYPLHTETTHQTQSKPVPDKINPKKNYNHVKQNLHTGTEASRTSYTTTGDDVTALVPDSKNVSRHTTVANGNLQHDRAITRDSFSSVELSPELEESDVKVFDYNIAFNVNLNSSALTTTAVATTTVGVTISDKSRLRNRGTKRWHRYRNVSVNLAASLNVVICIVCVSVLSSFLIRK